LNHAWAVPVRLVLSGGEAEPVAKALRTPYTRRDGLVLAGLAQIAAASSWT